MKNMEMSDEISVKDGNSHKIIKVDTFRLIDADNLKDMLDCLNIENDPYSLSLLMETVIDTIDEAPSIEPSKESQLQIEIIRTHCEFYKCTHKSDLFVHKRWCIECGGCDIGVCAQG